MVGEVGMGCSLSVVKAMCDPGQQPDLVVGGPDAPVEDAVVR